MCACTFGCIHEGTQIALTLKVDLKNVIIAEIVGNYQSGRHPIVALRPFFLVGIVLTRAESEANTRRL